MANWLKLYATYTFSTSPNLCYRTTLLNTDVQNCYITLEFITIILRVRHPSVERPPTDLLNVDLVRRSRFSLTFFCSSFWYQDWRKKRSFWVGRGSNDEFVSKNMKFTVRFGYWFRSCRARVILACLLAAVSSWALIFFFVTYTVDARPMDAGLAV